jgi:hypothetical protein
MTEQYLPRTINYDDGVSASVTATGATALGISSTAVVVFNAPSTPVGNVTVASTAADGTVLTFTSPGQYLVVASLDFGGLADAAIQKGGVAPVSLPVPAGFAGGNVAFQALTAGGTASLTALVTVTAADLVSPSTGNQVRVLASVAPTAGTLSVTGL